MKNEEIYKLVEKQETVLKEAVELKLSGFKAEIKSGMDMQVYKLELKQKEFGESLDNVQVNQAEQMSRINQIHYLLAGTDYESENNGGLVGEVKRIKRRVNRNTSWRIKITAVASAVMAVIGFILLKFGMIISTFKEFLTNK